MAQYGALESEESTKAGYLEPEAGLQLANTV